MNNLQIQHQWRKLMRVAKEEELKREIEVIAQSHERGIKRSEVGEAYRGTKSNTFVVGNTIYCSKYWDGLMVEGVGH